MTARMRQVPCTVEIEQTHDAFHAHVDLQTDWEIGPGDMVQVLGAPIQVVFGQKLVEHRRAIITRAGLLRRTWIKLLARFQVNSLYEVSFTPRGLI